VTARRTSDFGYGEPLPDPGLPHREQIRIARERINRFLDAIEYRPPYVEVEGRFIENYPGGIKIVRKMLEALRDPFDDAAQRQRLAESLKVCADEARSARKELGCKPDSAQGQHVVAMAAVLMIRRLAGPFPGLSDCRAELVAAIDAGARVGRASRANAFERARNALFVKLELPAAASTTLRQQRRRRTDSRPRPKGT
jgi:hypothetical protein